MGEPTGDVLGAPGGHLGAGMAGGRSWERVLNFIWAADDLPTAILMAPGKLQDKYCKIIKEKFIGFNREIEDIASTQKKYSIPDVELRPRERGRRWRATRH